MINILDLYSFFIANVSVETNAAIYKNVIISKLILAGHLLKLLRISFSALSQKFKCIYKVILA